MRWLSVKPLTHLHGCWVYSNRKTTNHVYRVNFSDIWGKRVDDSDMFMLIFSKVYVTQGLQRVRTGLKNTVGFVPNSVRQAK